MPRETMSPRERWLAVMRREKPDRVPLDYWATDEADAKLKAHLGVSTDDERDARLHLDRWVSVGGRYVGPAIPPHSDVFGCRYRDVDYGVGRYAECVFHPLAQYQSVDEIKQHYRWPNPDWWAYDHLPAAVRGQEHRPLSGGGSEPFLTYKNLRGMEQAYVDLLEHPDIVHYCLDRLFDLCHENTRRIYEAIPGRVMFSYVAEDLGGQEDLLFSPAHIREFLLPRMKRMVDLVHSAGAYAFHHTDGAVRRILPEVIAIGVDLLNPIQWRCRGMEREGLKRDFGRQLVFHGGMDNQYTLPFGTVDEVRQEVVDNLRILGAGGGYILAPCHNIQSVGPAENVVAMYDAAYELGWT
jgi:uroporphyrinogen decarboxylase